MELYLSCTNLFGVPSNVVIYFQPFGEHGLIVEYLFVKLTMWISNHLIPEVYLHDNCQI